MAETQTNGVEVLETREWLDSLDYVLSQGGPERAGRLLQQLSLHARRAAGVNLPFTATTPYQNTIASRQQPPFPGSQEMERRIKSLVRWNALAMVVRANKIESGIGGHISTFASAATLYEVAFNHFLQAQTESGDRDLVYFQGHAAPGMYSRAYLEGRIPKEKLQNFRRELKAGGGLSSYPHPWLMPDFWEFPTVSMGLGPIQAIYQARFIRYLENRGLKTATGGRVWAFMGDGEMDEPESLGSITLASRERLDNLIFVVNCNLQRLDGPVRGNGKIIQELEAIFRGAGWNVIKVIWGSDWDNLIGNDRDGILVKRMGEITDGQYQKYFVESGAYFRHNLFGSDPRLLKMVEHLSDEQLSRMRLGGHDPIKVHAAFKAATEHKGAPTVVLAKTIKGYGLGEAGEGKNITHQQKKLNEDELRVFRSRFGIPIADEELQDAPFHRPADDSPEIRYMQERRKQLGGYLPERKVRSKPIAPVSECALRGISQRHGRPRSFDHHGFRAAAGKIVARSGNRQADRAHHSRRSPHLRHGSALPPGGNLFQRGPALRAGGYGHASLLQGSQRWADSRRRHHRSRLDLLLYRRRNCVRQSRDQYDPVFYLLLDVRLPADRRSHLGRRRHAHSRLPDRRHGRPHHACRRGAAASGRSQPPARAAGPQSARL